MFWWPPVECGKTFRSPPFHNHATSTCIFQVEYPRNLQPPLWTFKNCAPSQSFLKYFTRPISTRPSHNCWQLPNLHHFPLIFKENVAPFCRKVVCVKFYVWKMENTILIFNMFKSFVLIDIVPYPSDLQVGMMVGVGYGGQGWMMMFEVGNKG